jgi:2-polyprenyl-3-methyl-5-hydroxy-6-metoxy-1,4-benzoquinol methylase
VGQNRYAEILDAIEATQHSRRGSFEAALAIADPLPRGRALDVPCGPGRLAESLGVLGFAAFAADLDAEGYRGHAPFCRLDLNAGLPYAEAVFDFIYCGDGIEHLENPYLMLRELGRVLADDGVLVVVTPNYLNIERRLQFLTTGALAKPPKRAPHYYAGPAYDRGHINPLTLTRMAYMAENAGMELVSSQTLSPKPRQRWLAPLALLVRGWVALLSKKRKHNLFYDKTQTWQLLMGGNQLLAVFRKSSKAPLPSA